MSVSSDSNNDFGRTVFFAIGGSRLFLSEMLLTQISAMLPESFVKIHRAPESSRTPDWNAFHKMKRPDCLRRIVHQVLERQANATAA